MIPFSESAVKDGQNGKTGEAGASGFSPTATKNTQFVLASLGRLCYTKLYAGVMESADVVDSKSTASDGVPVRVRPPAACARPPRSRRLFCVFLGKMGQGVGGTRAGVRVRLEGVSCVSGRTSSFPAGERNQRLPGAGEDSMRRAGPRTPLMQAACVGGASQGRPGRGSLRFRTNGPVENVPFSTTGLCLGEGRCGGEGRASHVTYL